MLPIKIPDWDEWDEAQELFVTKKGPTIRLEHSLISISKWEEVYHKPFLNSKKTSEEMLFYISCMCIDAPPPLSVLAHLTKDDYDKIGDYIEDPHTATWFREEEGKGAGPDRQVITSELIYYWMIESNIPFECKKWHIKRLLTLIRVVNEKRKPKKQMPRKEALSQRARLNAQRKAKLHTTG